MKFLKKIFNRPVTIIILIIVILVYGVIATCSMNINLLPDINFPALGISITYIGADAEVIEEQVTSVVYQGLSSLEDVHDITTYSLDSCFVATIQFDYGVSLDDKKSLVKEKLDTLNLPSECQDINILEFDLNSSAVTSIALYSTDDDFEQIYQDALVLQTKLTAISGVEEVDIVGGPTKQISIKTIPGLEMFSLLIASELSTSSYDIPLGTLYLNGEKVSINNNSFAQGIEDLKKTTLNYTLSSAYQSEFLFLQEVFNQIEEATTTSLTSYKEDIDKCLSFINKLETSSSQELDDMSSSISLIKSIIYLEENYSATSLDLMYKQVIKGIVEDETFATLSEDELQDLSTDFNISYDLLKYLQDHQDDAETTWYQLVDFKKDHPESPIDDQEYVGLIYSLGIASSDPQEENYLSEDDLLDVITLSRNINTVGLNNVIATLEKDIAYQDYLDDLLLTKDIIELSKLSKEELITLKKNCFDQYFATDTFFTYDQEKIAQIGEEFNLDVNFLTRLIARGTYTTKSNIIEKIDALIAYKDLIEDVDNLVTLVDKFDLFTNVYATSEKEDMIKLALENDHLDHLKELYQNQNENVDIRNLNQKITFINALNQYLINTSKEDQQEGLNALDDLLTQDFEKMTYYQLEQYCLSHHLCLDLMVYLQEQYQEDASYPVKNMYNEFINTSLSSFSGKLDPTLDLDLILPLSSANLTNYLDDLNSLSLPSSAAYSLLFANTTYDQSGLINTYSIAFARSKYFEDNYQTFYTFKENHQHQETTLVADEVTTTLVGDNLTSEEIYTLYNDLIFDQEISYQLSVPLISFIRDNDFSSTNFVTTIDQVASVEEVEVFESAAYFNNVKSIQLDVYAASSSNSSYIVTQAKKIISSFENTSSTKASLVSDQSSFISSSISNAAISLIIGGVLAVIVIYLFLRKVGSSLIISLTMPLSVLMTLICLKWMGITLNMVSVGGLAVGIGMLVDNSIVVLESISSERDKGLSALDAAVSGVKLVIGSLIGSTLTSICVFFPILFMDGLTKEIFSDLSYAVIFSLTFSLIFALTIIPTLYCLIYGHIKEKKIETEGKFTKKMKAWYAKHLRNILHHRWLTLGIGLLIFASSCSLLLCCEREFLPSVDMGQINVNITYSLNEDFADDETSTLAVSDYILENFSDSIDHASIAISKGNFVSTNVTGTISLFLKDNAKKSKDLVEDIREKIDTQTSFKSLNISLTALDGVVSTLMNSSSGTSITLKGESLDELENASLMIQERLLNNYSSFKEVSSSLSDKQMKYTLNISQEECYRLGLSYQNIVTSLRIGLSGYTGCSIVVDDAEEDVVISFDDKTFTSYYDGIENYIVGINEDASPIKLKDIASINKKYAYNVITRNQGELSVKITAQTYGITTGTASDIFKKVAREVIKENNYQMSFVNSGVSAYLDEAFEGLIIALVIAFFLLIGVMCCLFESFKKPFIVLFSIPLSFTGAFIMLVCTRMSINVVSFVGLIMLMGVIVNDAIVLIERITQMNENPELNHFDAVIEGCTSRLRAVLMTTLTTVLAIFPVALGIGKGGTLMQPLGIVVIGGMTLGTCVTLIIIPTIYCLMHHVKDPNYQKKKHGEVKEQ